MDEARPELSTSTIHLRPGHPQGYCVQRSLFYASDTWHAVLHADVDALLQAYVEAVEAQKNGSGAAMDEKKDGRVNKGKGKEKEVVEEAGGDANMKTAAKAGESPFQLFKRLWIELGWSKVHLLGVLDGPMRLPWGESVLRAFLEHLREDQEPLKQVAALFAVYTFWNTQARTQETVHVHVDPPTLEYILQLPGSLASSLASSAASPDPNSASGSPAPSSPPTPLFLDLSYVLSTLISRSAFFIIPTESYLFPTLPNTRINDANLATREHNAKLTLGAEEELEALRAGQFDLEEEGEERGENAVTDKDLPPEVASVLDAEAAVHGWPGTLRESRDAYLGLKGRNFGVGMSRFKNQVLSQAEDLTLKALEKAAPTAEGVVPGIMDKVQQGELDARGLGLFSLVGDVGDRKGLPAYLRAVEELQEREK